MSSVLTSISRRKAPSVAGPARSIVSYATTRAPSTAGPPRRRKKKNAQARSALFVPSQAPSGRSQNSTVGGKKAHSAAALARNPKIAQAYWNAASYKVPPALTTTFGNFTTVNSVARFTISTTAGVPNQFQFMQTRSAIRTYQLEIPLTSTPGYRVWQQHQLNSATNTVPLDIRPLRMCVKLRNTTAALDVAGSVKACLIPQSLVPTWGASNQLTAATWAAFWELVQDSPHSKVFTASELRKSHTMVMPPSSFVAYNSYSDFLSLTTADGAVMSAADWLAACGLAALPIFPATTTTNWPTAEVPSMYILLVNIEPNSKVQSYDFEVYCQDAVRYPANSLAASMAKPASSQTLTESVIQQLSTGASNEFAAASDVMDSASQYVQSHADFSGDDAAAAYQAAMFAANLATLPRNGPRDPFR